METAKADEAKTTQTRSIKSEYPTGETEGEPFVLPEPNPVTKKRHQREMLWQVYLPVGIGAVLVLLLITLTISGTDYWLSKGADVALIWVISPQLLVALIVIVINAAFIYGMVRLMKVIPSYSRLVLDYFLAVGVKVSQFTDKLVKPIINTGSFSASVRQLVRSVFGK